MIATPKWFIDTESTIFQSFKWFHLQEKNRKMAD